MMPGVRFVPESIYRNLVTGNRISPDRMPDSLGQQLSWTDVTGLLPEKEVRQQCLTGQM